jgi:hypothetical protein
MAVKRKSLGDALTQFASTYTTAKESFKDDEKSLPEILCEISGGTWDGVSCVPSKMKNVNSMGPENPNNNPDHWE